jgi:hypothetical protein
MIQPLERAKNLSRLMRHAVLALGLIVSAVALGALFNCLMDPAFLPGLLKARFDAFAPASISAPQLILFAALLVLQTAPLLMALLFLWRVFGAIATGGGVDRSTALLVRGTGLWFGAAALLMLVSTPLMSLISSIGALPGRQFLSVEFETQHLLAVLLSAVLITLGHVLALAADIADDNRLIV